MSRNKVRDADRLQQQKVSPIILIIFFAKVSVSQILSGSIDIDILIVFASIVNKPDAAMLTVTSSAVF